MAFGLSRPSLSPDVIDAIRRRGMPTDNVDDIQDQPPSEIQNYGRIPMDERLPNGSPSMNVGMRPITPTFTRGNDIANPAGDVSSVEYVPPAPVQTQSGVGVFQRPNASIAQPQGVQVDAMGVPTNAPQGAPQSNIHQHSLDVTDTGVQRPNASTYDASIDAKGNHIGRLSRFGHGFIQGAQSGGLLGGVFGGLTGLLVPSVGNRDVFNTDNARFKNEQAQEMGLERQNTGYQNQLEVQKRHQELPDEIARYQAQQQAMTGRQLAVGEQRDENRQTLQDQKDAAALERLGATWDAKSKAKLNERFADLRAESVNSGLTDDQIRDKAAQGIALEQKAALAKTNAQTAHYEELTKSTGERLKQGEQRLKIMQQNANTNAGRLAQGQSNTARVANNQAVNNQLKSLTSYVGSLKTQYTAHSKTLNDPYSSPEAKEAAEREMGRINKELDDVDTQQRGLTGAPARGAKGAPAAGGTHPNVGKTFTKDGKQYVADEIDSAGNITKYHEK